MSERYEYSPLDLKQRSIRLVEIIETYENWIDCRSHVFVLPELEKFIVPTLQFDALSYTWGAETPVREIKLDGKLFTVRENLWHALQSIKAIQSDKSPSSFAVAVRYLLSPLKLSYLQYELVEAGQKRLP